MFNNSITGVSMVLSIICTQQVNWKSIQASFLSLLIATIKNQESHFVKQHLHSLHGTTLLQIPTTAHRDALPKDADACKMQLAPVHIAMVANPALTKKTANLTLKPTNYFEIRKH